MKKVAFLVEPNFKKLHYGVRNYFSTIKEILSEKFEVEYITYIIFESEVLWYKLNFQDIETGEKKEDKYIKIDKNIKKFNYFKYLRFEKKLVKQKDIFDCYFQFLGTSLKNQNYDICIITNPWLLKRNCKIEAKKIYGFVYDFIANLFVLTKEEKPFDWSNKHRIGYEVYNKICDCIIADSEIICKQYKKIYPEVSDKVFYLKPFPPIYYKNVKYTTEKKENSIILAAPFDSRKGLYNMPELINSIASKLDYLYIFGKPRCTIDEFNDFFSGLNVKKIVYYPSVSNEKLIELYKKCKFLLFPSLEEGLGLPLIEAQICGCRVVTTNKKPMNTLGVNGYLYLNINDDAANKKDKKNKQTEKKFNEIEIKEINEILLDNDFDFKNLSKLSWERFSFQKILDFFSE